VNIHRRFPASVGVIVLACLPFARVLPSLAQAPHFVPPGIVAADDVPYPPNTLAAGAVSFVAHLDQHGHVESLQVTRDFAPFMAPAEAAVRTWTFSSATLDGKTVPSSVAVNVIFNVFDPNGLKFFGLKLPPPAPTTPDAEQFTPPQLLSASFARYPVKVLEAGTVVLAVSLTSSGAMETIHAIRGVPPLTSAAISATRSFAFSPAAFRGRPVASHIVIAFVFQYNSPVPSKTG